MSVWYRNAAQTGTGFCSDVDSAITVPVTGNVSNVFSRSVAGTLQMDWDNDGFVDTSWAETLTISGTYTGTIGGTLNGFNDYASGNISATLTSAAVGGTSSWAGAITCNRPNIATGNQYVYASGTYNGAFSAPYAAMPLTSPNVTGCYGDSGEANPTYAWTPNATPTLTGTVSAGTVNGTAAGNDTNVSFYSALTGETMADSAQIQFERPQTAYPGACLGLCASVECAVSTTPISFGIDDLTFEIFKFGPGSNPLDPSSTPPIKTISMYGLSGQCSFTAGEQPGRRKMGTYCSAWDGTYNLNGFFGKTNGRYGYRAKVTVRQTTNQGTSVDIEQTAAYPGQNQIPINIDVTDLHMAAASATAVGFVTRVPAQPYNIRYRLSKDATATISIFDTDASHQYNSTMTLVRTLIVGQPRIGEGIPDGTLANGDFWDGRNDQGVILPAGSYLARLDASSNDMWSLPPFNRGPDLSWPTTIQLTLDPLQITDVGMKPLGASSTDMAVISYLITEPATTYVEIYTPGTIFANTNVSPPVVASGSLLRRFVEEKPGRQSVSTYWDGRDASGYPVCDGDYVYAVYAEMPSAGTIGNHGFSWTSIKTRRTATGTVPVARGNVVAFMQPTSTVIGATVPVAGLNPFYFRYTPSRNVEASLTIRDMAGNAVRTVFSNEPRFSNTQNVETWDGRKDDGTYLSSGTYLAELVTKDPYVCSARMVSTTTALIPVHLFRIVDPKPTPLLGSNAANASLSYELSQSMYTDLRVYPTDTVINPAVWPPTLSTPTIFSVTGIRPGRMRITEPWDGRDMSGNLVPDGRYPYSLVAYSTGTSQVMYATDKVYGYLDVSRGPILFSQFDVYPTIPTMYSSSEVVKLPPYGIEYMLTRQSSVTVQVVTLDSPQPKLVAEVVKGEVRDGVTIYKDFWDGKCTATSDCTHTDFVTGGAYNIRVMAQELGNELQPRTTVQQTVDVFPIRIYDLSIAPLTMGAPAVVSYQVSEPMKVVTKVYKPGTNLTGPGDPANTLVKRLIGVRPARTQISEYWDGTDLTLSNVPDGNYVFKVYGSTITGNIDTLTGDVAAGTQMADDIIISNIPVIRSGTADLCKDFSRETYFAPNPYTGHDGWFHIPALMNGTIDLKLYNLAGELVYSKDFGLRGGGNNIDGKGNCSITHTHEACWPRTNKFGREVAPGVYMAVVRFEATEGTRDVCQVVKKILVP